MPHLIYIISDGTGETAATMIRAALVQFNEDNVNIVRFKNVRTKDRVEAVIEEAFENNAFITYTVVSPAVRREIQEITSAKGMQSVDLLGPLLHELAKYLGHEPVAPQVGKLRTVDETYFRRIEAMEFTVKSDDGKEPRSLHLADIVLVGISRTSKTPLSIFLSHKGWKVANVPVVLGAPLPKELDEIDQRKIVALTIDSSKLMRIRRTRLEKLGQDPGGDYASIAQIAKELEHSQALFRTRKRWPVLDVTEKALEETAAEITRIITQRMGKREDVLF